MGGGRSREDRAPCPHSGTGNAQAAGRSPGRTAETHSGKPARMCSTRQPSDQICCSPHDLRGRTVATGAKSSGPSHSSAFTCRCSAARSSTLPARTADENWRYSAIIVTDQPAFFVKLTRVRRAAQVPSVARTGRHLNREEQDTSSGHGRRRPHCLQHRYPRWQVRHARVGCVAGGERGGRAIHGRGRAGGPRPHVRAGMLQNLKSAGVPSPCRLPRAGERCFALALAPAIAKWRQVRRSPSSSAKAAKVA